MQIPTHQHLERAYYELQKIGARAVGHRSAWSYHPKTNEELLALCAEMSRFDPRLFGILVDYLAQNWKRVNPLLLRQAMQKFETPQAWGVMGEMISSLQPSSETVYFFEYVTRNLAPVSPQLYFINYYLPGSHLMQKAALEPLEEFFKWGFLARERPVIHGEKRISAGYWGNYARTNILKRLLTQNQDITLGSYLQALDHTISRQQALNDLKNFPGLKLKGKGRGGMWRKNI